MTFERSCEAKIQVLQLYFDPTWPNQLKAKKTDIGDEYPLEYSLVRWFSMYCLWSESVILPCSSGHFGWRAFSWIWRSKVQKTKSWRTNKHNKPCLHTIFKHFQVMPLRWDKQLRDLNWCWNSSREKTMPLPPWGRTCCWTDFHPAGIVEVPIEMSWPRFFYNPSSPLGYPGSHRE